MDSTSSALAWQTVLKKAWQKKGVLALLLWPIACLIRLITALRRTLYQLGVFKKYHAHIPVIVVGNVMVGGSGKTPLVIALVRHLQKSGLQVGVLSRGYGRQAQTCEAVLSDSPAHLVGDEPALIHRLTQAPVFVAPKRADAAQALLAAHPNTQVIVCDDGLQHYALHADIKICVFDNRGVGNGFIIPAGPLREPWPQPVDFVIHSGNQPAFAGFTAQRQLAPYAVRADGSQLALSELVGRPANAIAGIAQPSLFFDMLRALGIALIKTQALADHADFNHPIDLFDPAYPLLCTEKDACKLWQKMPQAWAVPLEFCPEPAFFQAFDQRLKTQLASLA